MSGYQECPTINGTVQVVLHRRHPNNGIIGIAVDEFLISQSPCWEWRRHVFKAEAYGALFAGLADPDGLLSIKVNQRTNVLALSNVTIPDQAAQDDRAVAKLAVETP